MYSSVLNNPVVSYILQNQYVGLSYYQSTRMHELSYQSMNSATNTFLWHYIKKGKKQLWEKFPFSILGACNLQGKMTNSNWQRRRAVSCPYILNRGGGRRRVQSRGFQAGEGGVPARPVLLVCMCPGLWLWLIGFPLLTPTHRTTTTYDVRVSRTVNTGKLPSVA